MGIHDNSVSSQNNASVQPQAAPQVNNQTPPFGNTQAGAQSTNQNANAMENALQFDQSGQFDWTNLNQEMIYQVNVSPNAMSLSQFDKAMREWWDQNISPDLNIDMFSIDRNSDPNLAVSIMVIVARPENKETAPIAYHTLLIENSIDVLPKRIVNVNNRPIEILQLTSDVYDGFMMKQIENHVRIRFPKASVFLDADAEVIPRHFDLTKEENIRNVTSNAVLACRSVLVGINPEFKDVNLQNARRNTSTLNQTTQFRRAHEQLQDQTGFPVRSDIVIETTASPTQVPNNYNLQNHTPLTTVTGYVDLLYLDVNNFFTQNQYWAQQQQSNITPVYQSNFVITGMMNHKMQTLAGTLLALVNATNIRENNSFLTTFMPSDDNKDDMHDIGNIGFDVPIVSDEKGPVYGKLPTTPDKFTMNELAILYTRFFHPGLAFSLDIPECGPTSWMYKVIASAAKGNVSAAAELRRAANILTNGNFDRHYHDVNGTGKMVFSNDNTIFLGYYETKDGRRRDIRDLDYLAVCGLLGKKGRDEIRVYTDSYNGAYSLDERVAYRRTLITTNFSKVVFTGRAYRVTFEDAFLYALIKGSLDCSYHVTPQQYTSGFTAYQRANATYINGAVLNTSTSGIFRNAGGINTNSGDFYYGRFY